MQRINERGVRCIVKASIARSASSVKNARMIAIWLSSFVLRAVYLPVSMASVSMLSAGSMDNVPVNESMHSEKGGESTEDHKQLRVVAHGFRAVRFLLLSTADYFYLEYLCQIRYT